MLAAKKLGASPIPGSLEDDQQRLRAMTQLRDIARVLQQKGLLPMLNPKCYFATTSQGGTGTGKTFTNAMIALGTSVELCDKAPVYVRDSEPSWQFLEPAFAAHGVKLIIDPGLDFKGMVESLGKAKKEGACVHLVDQMGAPWKDLLASFSDDSGYIGMQRQNQLRSHWDEFTAEWKNLSMHRQVLGRLGYEFIDYEEGGHMKFAKGDTKMKAGGGESFGYEGYLQLEFTREQDVIRDQSVKARRGRKDMRYICTVLKDQANYLTGMQFVFKNQKPGVFDYKPIFKEFKGYIEYLAKIPVVSTLSGDSRELVHTESRWQKEDTIRTIALEKFRALLDLLYGGSTRECKHMRQLIQFEITGTLSDTELEKQVFTKRLQWSAGVMAALAERIKGGDFPQKDDDMKQLIKMAKEDVAREQSGERNEKKSLLETQLEESILTLKKPNGRQKPASPETVSVAGAD
jgi:hypothetical protein